MYAAELLDAADLAVVHRHAIHMIGREHGDDAAGDVLLSVCTAALDIDSKRTAVSTINQALRWRRWRHVRRERDPECLDEVPVPLLPAIPASQLVSVELSEVLRTLRQLPQHLRQAIRDWVDTPNLEAIARRRGVTEGTIRGRLADARRILADPALLAELPERDEHRQVRGATTWPEIHARTAARVDRVRELDASGKTNAEIAQALGIGERRVRVLRARYRDQREAA